tara:strand:+ start:4651 stop:6129 length:1479 start_codon:yes stop_codon:yes gene_type:complete
MVRSRLFLGWMFLGMCVGAVSAIRAPSAPGWRTDSPSPDVTPSPDVKVGMSPDSKIGMPERYTPVGFSTAKGEASDLRRQELPGCHLHFFRHVSKAAGTTMRFIFDKQVGMGEWEFLPMCHYGFREKDWKSTLDAFRAAAVDPENVKRGTGPRVIVEARNEWGATEAFEDVILKDLKELKEHLAALGCGVTTSLLFREPARQYKSFWMYYIQKLRDDADQKDLSKGPEAWGESFEEWAANIPDLQLRELLGDRCTPKLREPIFETYYDENQKKRTRKETKKLPETCKISNGDRTRFEKLIKQINVVGTTDKFDLFWLQVADKTGFQHLEYVPSNKKKELNEVERKDADGDTEPDVSGLSTAFVNDRWAYELVGKMRDERIQEECGDRVDDNADHSDASDTKKCDLTDREEKFLELTKKSDGSNDGKVRVGGIGPPSQYMFVPADPVSNTQKHWVRPDFYVKDPICKGFGVEFSALVFKNNSEFKCDRGCSFD